MAVVTIGELHNAVSAFVVHLRGDFQQVENAVADVYDRIESIELGAATSGELGAHIASPTPHPVYDQDLPNLSVMFDNLIL